MIIVEGHGPVAKPPLPQLSGSQSAVDRTQLTDMLLSLTREFLDRPDVTLDDDFFVLGGDSITAMHVVGELARRTRTRIRVSLLFANPALRDFADAAANVLTANGGSPDAD